MDGENKNIKISDDDSEEDDDIMGNTFFKKYKCIQKLGEGSFGRIYKAEYNGEYFALKFENKFKGQGLLESEAAIMNYLKGPNIPFVKSFGYTSGYNILVMQLLGKSLEDIFVELKRFSLKSVCMLAFQMISVLEYIHRRHIVHRDIKPDNFVMGLDDLSQFVYLLDFGLAKKYRSSTTLIQYPMINKKKLTGTARYASINALRGYEQSRRDDLEAVGYVLMYLLRGSLPWQGLQAKNKDERYKKILQRKIDTSAYDLCYGFPNEFETYIETTRNMEYTEEPVYDMLRWLFMKVLKREKYKFDYIYDWTTPEEKRLRKEMTLKTDGESNNRKTAASLKKSSKGGGTLRKNHLDKVGENDEGRVNNNNNEDNYENNCGESIPVKYNNKSRGSKDGFRVEKKDEENEENEEDPNVHINPTQNVNEDVVCCSSGCIVF